MHCGGPTSRAGTIAYDPTDPYADPYAEADDSEEYSTDYSIRHAAERADSANPGIRTGSSGGGTKTSAGDSPYSIRDAAGGGAHEEDIESDPGEQKGSVLGSLFQSMGGIIWVLLLIGFSLARSCGE